MLPNDTERSTLHMENSIEHQLNSSLKSHHCLLLIFLSAILQLLLFARR